MDDIELEARRSTRGSYDVLPQLERDPRSPPSYNDELIAGTSEDGSQMRPSNSMSKSLLTTVESRDSISILPPRSFSQDPTSKRIWVHIATATAALLLVGIPIGILMMAMLAYGAEGLAQDETYCTIGNFYGDIYSSGFSTIFNIDTAFGELSFGTAKFIDLVWDIGFSRCGQAMLGWITYQVNTSALLRIMETKPISYELFSTLSLSWSSVASLGPVIKSFFAELGFRKRLILFWILLSIIWVAFWPTITNAMTGYVAENNTLVKVKGGTAGYVDISNLTSISNLAFQFFNRSSYYLTSTSWTVVPIGPILLSTGPDTTLWNDVYRIFSGVPEITDAVFYNSTPVSVFYFYQNQTYDPVSYFGHPENVQCVATGVYQWGFSLNILFAFTIINGLWFIGTYGVWIHMNRKSELCRKGRQLGQYRAAVDLVESIQEDLGKNICAYSEQELKKELEKQGGIKYYVEHGEGDVLSHIGVTSSRDKGPVSLRFGELYGQLRQKEL